MWCVNMLLIVADFGNSLTSFPIKLPDLDSELSLVLGTVCKSPVLF